MRVVPRVSVGVLLSISSLFWLNEARSSGKSVVALETESVAASASHTVSASHSVSSSHTVSGSHTVSASHTESASRSMSAAGAASTSALLASMTFDRAVRVMDASGHADQKLISMIRDHKGHQGHKKVRGGSQPVVGQPTGSAGNSQSNYYGGVWAALHRMNDMLLETLEKWDLKIITCDHYNESTSAFKEDIEADLEMLKPLISDAMSDKNAASAKIKTHSDAASKLEDDIDSFLKEMTDEMTSLMAQLRIAKRDQQVMSKILNMTQCNDASVDASFVQKSMQLLQCRNSHTGKSFEKIKITDTKLKREFAGMQHPKVIGLLRAAGINVDDNAQIAAAFLQKSKGMDCGCACHNNVTAGVRYQALFGADQRNNTCNIVDNAKFSFLDNCCILNPTTVAPCCPLATMPPEIGFGVAVTNTSSEMSIEGGMPPGGAVVCKLDPDSGNCPELRERFLNINGGIWDTITQLKYLIRQTEFRKEQGHRIMQAELSYHNEVAESENEKFGRASAELSTLLETQREKTSLRDDNDRDMAAYLGDCTKVIKELENEYCALMIIRAKLLEMDALPNNVTDCRVSNWEAGECSLTCGNGVQMNTRSIEMPPDHGYACPALEVKTACPNIDPRCPMDCELGDWTGWSACSAMCDGGVMDRIRPVLQHPSHDGTPCDVSDDAQDCNAQACDVDCVLEDWTEWSTSCTKVCGGGRQIRYKHIKEKEIGRGTCPEFHDARRFQWKPCNTHECQHDDHKLVLCEAQLDIILAIDGSGSLRQTGWEAVKLAALHFAGSMGAGVRLGALVFDSAKYEKEGDVCMGHLARSEWRGPWTNCGVRWAHKLTMDTKAVQDGIRKMEPTFRGTMTNVAVDQASAEFTLNGRNFANSVLVVLTDGYPQSKLRLEEAAERFKGTGRLMFVTVGGNFVNDEYFQKVASYPYQDNIVSAMDFKELTTRKVQDTIVQQFCPNIVLQPDPENPPPVEQVTTLFR